MSIKELNNSTWFSHNLNEVDTNIHNFEMGSGCTALLYNYEDYGEIFSCVEKKTDYLFKVEIRDSVLDKNGKYIIPQRFDTFTIIIENMNNPKPTQKLKNYIRTKKIKNII
jgi:hypothetical protein